MIVSNQLFFEDVTIGDEIPSLIREIDLVKNVMYAAATWDFHRHHYDKEFADKKGFPGTFVDGQEFGSFLVQLVTHWTGVGGVLRELDLNYRVMAFPGDILTCKGRVAEKHTNGEENLVRCELWIENQRDEKVVEPAHAVLALPSRSNK
jgi:acyl dehydratase